MASMSTDARGNRTIQFIAADRKRRTIRLGKQSLKIANEIKTKVHALNGAKIAKCSPDTEVAAWVGSLPPTLYDKLASVGLVPKRAAAAEATLGAVLDGYISGRSDVKTSTATVYNHTRRCLIEYFGADKPLADITAADADDWRRYLVREKDHESGGQGLGINTARRRCCIAKQFFRAAHRGRLIAENPFGDMKGISVQRNKERFYFITRDEAHKVLVACPDAQWKLIFALCRFGGLRCPSEHMELRWRDIDWAANKITIHSPKTAHHGEEHAYRVVPLFPELRPYLEAVRDLVNPGYDTPLSEPVITRYRGAGTNLRSQLKRFIKNAKLQPWPKLFQNLRSTRQTELTESFPSHVVCEWMGNSEKVADQHYLQVKESHFEAACSALQNPVQHAAALDCIEPHEEKRSDEITGKNDPSSKSPRGRMGVTELESVTSCMSSKRSNQLSYTPEGGFQLSAVSHRPVHDQQLANGTWAVLYGSRHWLRRQGPVGTFS